MDTDSIFVPPEHAKSLIEFFRSLNPYSMEIPLLKIEYEDVWFFGISSKRYVLYRRKNKEIELVSYKLRGLGHLRNPFSDSVDDWQGEIWSCTDGISENHGLLCREIFRSSKRSRIL
jgi:hypothetical protein